MLAPPGGQAHGSGPFPHKSLTIAYATVILFVEVSKMLWFRWLFVALLMGLAITHVQTVAHEIVRALGR